MRLLAATALAALLVLPAAADTESWVRAQRRIAASQLESRKQDAASETLRLAVVGARRAGLRVEEAKCLMALAEIESRVEHDPDAEDAGKAAAPALLRAALRAARSAGDVRLESSLLTALAFDGGPDEEGLPAQRLDAGAVSGDVDALLDLEFFETDIAPALEFLDLQASAALALKGGRTGDAAKMLATARDLADKAGWTGAKAFMNLRLSRLANDSGKGDAAKLAKDAAAGFATLGNLASEAEAGLELGRALAAAGKSGDAKAEFEKALLNARELRSYDLEGRLLQALAGIADPASKPALLAQAARVEEFRHRRVLDEAARAVEEGEDCAAAAESLSAEVARRPDDAAACDRLRTALGFGPPAPRRELPADYRKHLVAALAGEEAFVVLIPLEILGRHDAWPVIAEAAAKSGNAWPFANAVETLATREDWTALFALLETKDANLAEAAAAAILRLATDADVEAVRKALGKNLRPSVAIYL
ncbi:MAG: hypothetical protein K8T20_18295, partial [Planctomycetes bacterium]|nr:hypothetical protein [Planctomycetota bacterium]